MTNDQEALKVLEVSMGRELTPYAEGRRRFNYTLDEQGSVTGLFLGNDFKNTELLTQFKSLERLTLSFCEVKDAHLLSQLPLKELRLYGTIIEDFEWLTTLKEVTLLDLTGNDFPESASLIFPDSLTYLNLDGTLLQDFSTLSALKNLEELSLASNKISDPGSLSPLVQLKSLNLCENDIQDLTPLASLMQLESLYLQNNKIEDLSPLRPLQALNKLVLSENSIENVAPLISMGPFKTLDLRNNQIRTLPPGFLRQHPHWIFKYSYWPEVNFYGNPLESPPSSVIEQGMEAVRIWYN